MSAPLFCARSHPMRFDPERGRNICPICEGIGKKRVAPKAPAANSADISETPPAPRKGITTRSLSKPSRPTLTEDEVQTGSIGALRARNYLVHVNSVRLKAQRVTCSHCGGAWMQRPEYNTGQTPGIPDLAVSSAAWRHPLLPAALWVGLEQKGTTGSPSPEQKKLRDEGFIIVSKTVETNLEAAEKVSKFFGYVAGLERLRALCEGLPEGARGPDIAAALWRLQQFEPPPEEITKPKTRAKAKAKVAPLSKSPVPHLEKI